MPHLDDVYDPGLQQERTVLAWDRTGLALMVASGLLLRALGPLARPIMVVPLMTFLLGMAFLLRGRPRYLARWRSLREGRSMAAPRPVWTVAAGTVILGLTALIVTLTSY